MGFRAMQQAEARQMTPVEVHPWKTEDDEVCGHGDKRGNGVVH